MTRARLRAAAAIVVLAVALGVTAAGCTSSGDPGGGPSATATCSWSDRASQGALIEHGAGLFAFDPESGAELGHCVGAGLDQDQPPFHTSAGEDVARAAGTYVRPPVAGPSPTLLAHNAFSDGDEHVVGGVITLRGGAVTRLSFAGWQVITTIGRRLLLQRLTASRARSGGDSTSPADWCLLPSPSSPLSRCSAVPGADAAGSPVVTPAGSVGWIPTQPQSLVVDGAPGLAATDGSHLTGYVLTGVAQQSCTAMDARTVVFAPGDAPSSAGQLTWVTTGPAGGRLTVHAVHHAALSVAELSGLGLDPALCDNGTSASQDGNRLAVLGAGGRVTLFGDSGHSTVRLHLGAAAPGALLRWPFDTGSSAG